MANKVIKPTYVVKRSLKGAKYRYKVSLYSHSDLKFCTERIRIYKDAEGYWFAVGSGRYSTLRDLIINILEKSHG